MGDATVHADGMSYRDVDDGRLRDLALRDPELRTDAAPVDMSLAHELEARAGHWLDTAGPTYGDPYPVSDYLFLVSYAGPGPGQFNLYLLDLCGNQVPFYSDPEMGSHGPLLVRPSSVFTTCPTALNVGGDASPETSWGKVLVTDVYRGLPDIERGRARYIQIMEQVPKTHEWARRAYDQSPVMGYGTYYAKRCWGRVDIAADGSAYFELPALREVYLQVLDAEGRELQRQTSSIQVMPGELRSCIGCHEPRPTTPPTSSPLPMAARQPPTRPTALPWTRRWTDRFCRRRAAGTRSILHALPQRTESGRRLRPLGRQDPAVQHGLR